MDAAGFDDWYVNMSQSDRLDAIVQRALGLPPELESSSLLPWDGIAEVVDVLGLAPGDVLVDLACGRGGYGVEIALRTRARLVGVDFSAVAVARAGARAIAARVDAEYVVGELIAVPLPAASADALVCVDAMQFADPYPAGIAECLRVLRPGGRLVLTGWEARDPADESVPARLRHDIGAALHAGGFAHVEVREMPHWRDAERTQWELAVAEDPAGDPAIEALRREGESVLRWMDRARRVLVRADRPA